MKAIAAFEETEADTLFELVFDDQGAVRKARLVRTSARRRYHEDMEAHAQLFEFNPSPENTSFRAFYFPVRYTSQHTFEWL